QPDAQGQYRRADNICVNGFLNGVSNYIADSCSASINSQSIVATTESKRKSGHGWAPMASATAYFSGSSRVYLRYAEAYRFPSMFESTIGFSASINPLQTVKPEHIYSGEAAYVQDLRDFFSLSGDQHADLNLTWYRNKTRNVIERSTQLMFFNLDKQVIEGLELQARFDNGRFFTEIGAAHIDEFIGGPIADRIGGYGLNVPYRWGEIVTLDAYATFRLNDRFSAELVGTNLTNRYYLDPLSRSLTPAPGRTVRLSLTGRL
ncbi:MAG: TonB-dependent receptor, partial [Novosphingobium sp.]